MFRYCFYVFITLAILINFDEIGFLNITHFLIYVQIFRPVSLELFELSKIICVELLILNFVKFPTINCVELSITISVKLLLMISIAFLMKRSIVLLELYSELLVINSIKPLTLGLALEMLVVEDTGQWTHNPNNATAVTRTNRTSMLLTVMAISIAANTYYKYNYQKLDSSASAMVLIDDELNHSPQTECTHCDGIVET